MNAAGFNPKGISVRITGPGAHCRDLYSFARVSAVLKLRVDDYYHNGARRRLKLHEKGGKEHEMPVHHLLEQILASTLSPRASRAGTPVPEP